MNNLVKVFVNSNGELNTSYRGKLASLSDLENSICEGQKEILGLLQLADGQYCYQTAEQQRNILMLDEEITEEELNECIGEYVKVNNEVNPLYTEFINDTDELLEEIVNVAIDEDDTVLRAVTRSTQNNAVYIYNYHRKENGDIDKIQVIANKYMFEGLFTV